MDMHIDTALNLSILISIVTAIFKGGQFSGRVLKSLERFDQLAEDLGTVKADVHLLKQKIGDGF